jgi:adenylate cyclase class 2
MRLKKVWMQKFKNNLHPYNPMELEMKFTCSDTDTIEKALLSEGFDNTKKKHQIDSYLIVNKKNEDGTRDYFRVRKDLIKGSCSMDYHRVHSALETEEFELDIDNTDTALTILKQLGFEVDCIVDKNRIVYKKENIEVTIDTVKELGTFVELEIEGEKDDETEKRLLDLALKLGLEEANRVSNKGYPDLLKENK